jgi:plastocyanin
MEPMPMRSQVVSSLMVLSLLASSASAGVISGTISKGGRAAAPPRGKQAAASSSALSETVVYVEAIPPPVERKLTSGGGFWFFKRHPTASVAGVVQAQRQFKPRLLAIAAGTRVAFHNYDDQFHSTFSVSAAKRFELGKRAPGRSDTVLFAHPGVVNLHCDIHPDMVGYVVVTPNHAFARADSLGRYRLPDLPRGTYVLRLVHPRWGERERTVEVPPRGGVTVDFAL